MTSLTSFTCWPGVAFPADYYRTPLPPFSTFFDARSTPLGEKPLTQMGFLDQPFTVFDPCRVATGSHRLWRNMHRHLHDNCLVALFSPTPTESRSSLCYD